MEDETANESVSLVPQIVVGPTEKEVVNLLVEQSRFESEPELRASAARLLEAGYTMRIVSRKLGLRPVTLFRWSQDPELAEAIARGREYRKQVLGQGLESAAEDALVTLQNLANDPDVAPKDRITASQTILDRCGLVSSAESTQATGVSVDIDFDERLARIVAASKS
jgi:hypothetical protein